MCVCVLTDFDSPTRQISSHKMNSTTSRAANTSTRPQQWAIAYGSQKRSTMAIMTLLIWLVMTVDVAQPADTLYLCMKNCEQCKSMYGAYFEGDLCAKSCFRLKGAFIPDCIDVASIGQFLNKNEWTHEFAILKRNSEKKTAIHLIPKSVSLSLHFC